MRKNYQKQMPLMITSIDHPHATELEGISQILDANPIIYEWVLQDLTRNPKSAIGFGWVSSLRFVAAKKTFQQVHRLLPAAI